LNNYSARRSKLGFCRIFDSLDDVFGVLDFRPPSLLKNYRSLEIHYQMIHILDV